MPIIQLETFIKASPEVCFDLSRSIELHLRSTHETGETVVAGVKSGLMGLNDEVTWRARHLGFTQDLTSRITEYQFPIFFVSEMQKGIFKKLHHQHRFFPENGGTRMVDIFDFEAPFGILGRLACIFFLTSYMKRFLLIRNETIRKTAEHDPTYEHSNTRL
jgi:ligand-binding SRPBCC domain-containing protein